jgi:glucose-1-phosphate thymidylyltransferase
MTNKAVLLLGGTGTRLKRLTRGKNKHLLQVGGLTLAEHACMFLSLSGARSVTIVTPAEDYAAFYQLLGAGVRWEVELDFVVQPEPRGTADALRCASARLRGEERFIVMFGDNVFELEQGHHMDRLGQGKLGRILIANSTHPRDFSVAAIDPSGRLSSIQVKPDKPPSHQVCVGLFIFSATLLGRLNTIIPNQAGERDIMAVVCDLCSRDSLEYRFVQGCWFDVGTSCPEFRKAAQFVQERGINKLSAHHINGISSTGRASR